MVSTNKKKHHEPQVNGSSNIRKGWLLWCDVKNRLSFHHHVDNLWIIAYSKLLHFVQYRYSRCVRWSLLFFEGLDRPIDILRLDFILIGKSGKVQFPAVKCSNRSLRTSKGSTSGWIAALSFYRWDKAMVCRKCQDMWRKGEQVFVE